MRRWKGKQVYKAKDVKGAERFSNLLLDQGLESQMAQLIYSFNKYFLDFPGGPVAKIPCSQCRGLGVIPGQRTRSHMPQLRIPHPAAKIKDPMCYN